MEGNRRKDAPNLAGGAGRDSESERTPTSSFSSSITVDSLKRRLSENENATSGCSTNWTDKKHNLYLNFLEASFVSQLHTSMNLLAWCSRKKSKTQMSSEVMPSGTINSSQQFSVLQDGNWKKIDFQMGDSQFDMKCNSLPILETPRVRRFRSVGKCPVVNDTRMGRHHPCHADANYKTEKPCSEVTISDDVSVCDLQYETPVSSITEGSDQNFFDEDQKSVGRFKVAAADASGKD